MKDDPIVEEIHRVREQMLARYGGELHALARDAQRRTEEAARAGRKVAVFPAGRVASESEPVKRAG